MNTDILDDARLRDFEAPSEFVLASKSKRFANLLVDTIIFYISYNLLTIFFLILDGMFSTTMRYYLFYGPLGDRITGILSYFLFFLFIEWLFKGRTIGKFATSTKTVMSDGSPLTFKAILKKSGSRLVPFEAFSFFGSDLRGLHDKLSNTVVIDLKKLKFESARKASIIAAESTHKTF